MTARALNRPMVRGFGGDETSNPVLETLLAHRSVRAFTKEPVSEAQLDLILEAAQRSPTSSNMQAYSIVVVDDRDLREKLCAVCAASQRFVAECAVLLVFCSDISRLVRICVERGYTFRADQINTLLVAHGDANIACQSASVAAQSMGLGTCMLGNVRNDPPAVSRLLGLPRHVYASVGLAIGHPADPSACKPRLPRSVMVSRNRYGADHLEEGLAAYDDAMRAFGAYDGRREPLNDVPPGTPDRVKAEDYGWREHTARRLGGQNQLDRRGLAAFLESKGFSRR